LDLVVETKPFVDRMFDFIAAEQRSKEEIKVVVNVSAEGSSLWTAFSLYMQAYLFLCA
jgi:hypothetical protein